MEIPFSLPSFSTQHGHWSFQHIDLQLPRPTAEPKINIAFRGHDLPVVLKTFEPHLNELDLTFKTPDF